MSKLAILFSVASLAVASVALYRTLPKRVESEVGAIDRPLHRNRETASIGASLLNGCEATEEQLRVAYDRWKEELARKNAALSAQITKAINLDDLFDEPEPDPYPADSAVIIVWAKTNRTGQETRVRLQSPCLAAKIRELDDESWRKLCGNLFEGLHDRKSFVSACHRANVPE